MGVKTQVRLLTSTENQIRTNFQYLLFHIFNVDFRYESFLKSSSYKVCAQILELELNVGSIKCFPL